MADSRATSKTSAAVPPRRRADAERNHAAIVEAALALFAERPEATMAEVAASAGVGRVTLYAHFPSRHALLEAVVDRAIAETVAQPLDEVPCRCAGRRRHRRPGPQLLAHASTASGACPPWSSASSARAAPRSPRPRPRRGPGTDRPGPGRRLAARRPARRWLVRPSTASSTPQPTRSTPAASPPTMPPTSSRRPSARRWRRRSPTTDRS